MGLGSMMGGFVKGFEGSETNREKAEEKRNKIEVPKGMYTGNSGDEVANGETAPTIEYDKLHSDMTDVELLDAISRNEGTYKTGYNTEYNYGKYGGGRDTKLSDMTIDEVLKHQDTMIANQSGNKLKSSAVGRYQMLQQTLKDEMEKGNYAGDTKFTDALQDKMIMQRLKRIRKYDSWKSGDIDSSDFQYNLSKEFASIQNPRTGRGYHKGQGAKPLKVIRRNEIAMPMSENDNDYTTSSLNWSDEKTNRWWKKNA